MAESIIISLGGGLGHFGHFSHFNHLHCFNFFNHSGGVGSLGDNSSNGNFGGKSDDSGCKQCRSEGKVNDHSLTPNPSILSSNSMIDWWCFGVMMEFGTKKKRCKNAGERMVNSQQR